MQEVGRPVERIDDPAVGFIRARDGAALLHQEAVARARLAQFRKDDVLCPMVGGGDEIRGAFDGDLQLLDLAEIAREGAAGLAGGAGHDVDQGRSGHVAGRLSYGW